MVTKNFRLPVFGVLMGPYFQTKLNIRSFLVANFLKQFRKMLSFIFITDYNEDSHRAAIQ